MPNPNGTDGLENEYFKLINLKDFAIKLEGYKVCNVSEDCYEMRETIQPKECLKIFRKDFKFTLHNDKEELSIFDKEGALLDKTTMGAAPSGKAWICGKEKCSFDDPKEDCLFNENPLEEEILQTENESSEEKEDQSVTNLSSQEVSSKSQNVAFEINSPNDWSKAFTKIREGTLASLLINVQGRISIPKEAVQNNIFYLSAFGKLVKTTIYSSALFSLDYPKDQFISISNGYLKYQGQSLVIGIGKITKTKKITQKSSSQKSKKKVVPFNSKKAKQLEGRTVKVNGEILEKKGDYFFLKSSKDGENLTIYFPKPLWMKFQGTKDAGKAFPVYFQDPNKDSDWKDAQLNLKGVVEYKNGSSRIIVRDINEVSIKKKINEVKKLKEISSKKIDNQSNDTESISENSQKISESKDAFQPPVAASLPEIAQKISWKTLWFLSWNKIKGFTKNWF